MSDDPFQGRLLNSLTRTKVLLGGICENTIRSLVAKGELEMVYVADRAMITSASILALMNRPPQPRRRGRPRNARPIPAPEPTPPTPPKPARRRKPRADSANAQVAE
jgi:hypothetical protein